MTPSSPPVDETTSSLRAPHQVLLRDGSHATARSMERGDEEGLLELERAVVMNGRGVVKGPADLPESAAEWTPRIDEWLALDPAMGLALVATIDGRLVAEATIRRLPPSLIRHVALVALQVHPDVQGRGLGRALMDDLLRWARRTPTDGADRVLRVELYVRADNVRARSLYRSLGFEDEGRRRAFVRDSEGRLHDDWVMGLLLDQAR